MWTSRVMETINNVTLKANNIFCSYKTKNEKYKRSIVQRISAVADERNRQNTCFIQLFWYPLRKEVKQTVFTGRLFVIFTGSLIIDSLIAERETYPKALAIQLHSAAVRHMSFMCQAQKTKLLSLQCVLDLYRNANNDSFLVEESVPTVHQSLHMQ